MKPKSMLIVSLMVLMTVSPMLLIFPSAGALPPPTGDWIISGTETVQGGLHYVNDGNIIVQNGGVLTLDNAEVRIFDPTNQHYKIEIQRGGTLIMKNDATTRLEWPDNYMYFYMLDGSTVDIDNGNIFDVGDWNNNAPSMDRGIYINSDNVSIDNSFVSRCAVAIVIEDSSPQVTNTTFTGNAHGAFRLLGGDPFIYNNNITNNAFGWPNWMTWNAIDAWDTDARISDNDIIDNGWNGNNQGSGIFAWLGDPRIDNNTIENNAEFGVMVMARSGGVIEDNTIRWNQNGGILILDSSDTDVLRNKIWAWDSMGIAIDDFSSPYVQENTVNATGGAAVYISGASSPTFDGNTILQWAGGDAVTINDYSNVLFRGNDIYAENGDAFDMWNSVTARIEGNTIDCSQEGIQAIQFTTVKSKNNDITSTDGAGVLAQSYTIIDLDGETVRSRWAGIYGNDHTTLRMSNSVVTSTDDMAVISRFRSNFDIESSKLSSTNSGGIYSERSVVNVVNSSVTAANGIDMYHSWAQFNYPSLINTLNTTFDQNDAFFENSNSRLNVSWYAETISVEWQNGRAIPLADVSIQNVNGKTVYTGQTNILGEITWLPVMEYTEDQAGRVDFTRHNFTSNVNNVTGFAGANVNQNVRVRIVLQDILNDPQITILNPSDGDIFNYSNINVNGTANDPESGIYSVNIIPSGQSPVMATGTKVWNTTLTLADGDWDIDVDATNYAGVTETESVSITVDTVPPDLDITYPPATLLVNYTNITLTGNTEPGSVVTVDGTVATVDANGDFSMNLTLPEGVNKVRVNSHDIAMNFAFASVEVTVDLTPPNLEVFNPPKDILTGNPLLVVAGAVEAGANLTLGTTDIPFVGEAFTTDVDLNEGINTLVFKATDAAGNSATVTRIVTLDTTPPVVEVYNPAEDKLTNEEDLNITGWTEDTTIVDVKVNGQDVTVDDDGNFSVPVTLEEGTNEIEVKVIDEMGHVTIIRRFVELDTIAPPLEIFEPKDGLLTNNPALTVKGATELGVNVTINGEFSTPVLDDGTFEYVYTLLEGSNIITVVATDPAGNPTTEARNVTLDTIAPDLTIKAPKKGESMNEYLVRVKGNTEVGALVTVNGEDVTNNGGKYSIDIALKDGSNKIVVTATDAAGNVALQEVKVVREGFTSAEAAVLGIGILLLVVGLVVGLLMGRKSKKKGLPPEEGAMDELPYDEPTTRPDSLDEPMAGDTDVGGPSDAGGPDAGPPSEPEPPEPEGKSTEGEAPADSGSTSVEDPKASSSEPGPPEGGDPDAKKLDAKKAEGEVPPQDSSGSGSGDTSLESIMNKL